MVHESVAGRPSAVQTQLHGAVRDQPVQRSAIGLQKELELAGVQVALVRAEARRLLVDDLTEDQVRLAVTILYTLSAGAIDPASTSSNNIYRPSWFLTLLQRQPELVASPDFSPQHRIRPHLVV